MMNIVQFIQDVFPEVAQELTVFSVFFISLILFNYLGQRNKAVKKQKSLASSPRKPSLLPKKAGLEHRSKATDCSQPADIQKAEKQMLQLLESNEFTRALNLYRGFLGTGRDHQFSEALLLPFIQSAIRVGKIDVVERLLRSMMSRRSSKPSDGFWQTTVKMLSSRKHFETCLWIYNTYGSSLPTDKVIFSCLINGALENKAPKLAAAMIDRYCEADLEAKDYVLVFRTYVATKDLESAEKLFESLGEAVTSMILNLLLLICVSMKRSDRALQHLHKAQDLQEHCASKADGKSPEVVSIVDIVSYNTVIKGFAEARMLPQCFDVLYEMRAHKVEPDDITLGTLLNSCIMDNDMANMNEVVDLLVCRNRPVDTVMYSLFIKGLVRSHRLPKAMELYNEMKRRSCSGSKPDVVTYSVLIKACVDVHDLEQALTLVEDMNADDLIPDDIILVHLLEGCRFVGNHELGKKLFTDIVAAGVKPSALTLTSMVKLHGRCGAHEEACQLVKDWSRQYGMQPSVIHYTCLMSGCIRSKNYDQAWEAYKLMLEMHVRPDETTMSTIIPAMAAAKQWDRVIALVTKGLVHKPTTPLAPEVLNSALAQMEAASGEVPRAMELRKMMQNAGICSVPQMRRCRQAR